MMHSDAESRRMIFLERTDALPIVIESQVAGANDVGSTATPAEFALAAINAIIPEKP